MVEVDRNAVRVLVIATDGFTNCVIANSEMVAAITLAAGNYGSKLMRWLMITCDQVR